MGDLMGPALAVLLMGGLGGGLWLLRRRGAVSVFPAATKQMRAMERIPLSAQHALHLVQVNEKLILVVTGPGCCEVRNVE